MAQLSRATRFLAPVLVKMLLTWLSTVRLLIVSVPAISWLVSPWATSSMISISRSEISGRTGPRDPAVERSESIRPGHRLLISVGRVKTNNGC